MGLTWRRDSIFTRRRRGELQEIDDALEVINTCWRWKSLPRPDTKHYELSNFARPGFRCRHNLVYWHGEEYLAYGPGAARYVRGRRETNIRSVIGWLNRMERNESPVVETEADGPISSGGNGSISDCD